MVELYGRDLFGEVVRRTGRGPIADRFVVPPFSVLNAREGFWQERKRAWLGYGLEGEVDPKGRESGLTHNTASWFESHGKSGGDNTTSVFDPVLCELSYLWFCPPGGQVVDPFAGGSVRGIVAAMMDRTYWGCDLRPEQIASNEEQAEEIVPDARPTWVCGDAMDALEAAPAADFLFSCPPYGDLERYSDEPEDLSTMEWHTFTAAYKRIILRACRKLKPNRFACFVVGNFRDKRRGIYRDLVGETVRAFEEQGLGLYNEAILVTSVGSLPIRITKQFNAGRKLGKTHQNVLVFVKGDPRKAAAAQEKLSDSAGATE